MADFSSKEKKVLETFISRLKVPKRANKKKIVVGLVGLVGSGKKMVAGKLARELKAVIVSADDIRLALRKKKIGFDKVREIILRVVEHVLSQGGNVVIDSDFANPGKRNDLKKIANDGTAELYLIRTVVDYDELIGRIITGRYDTKQNDIFAGANTTWSGVKKSAVVKLREMWRRTPHHYTWSHDAGGQWIQKTISHVYATVDTTKATTASKKIKEIARRIGK